MSINPCYKCEDRQVGCHSTCQNYTQWKEDYNNKKAKIDEVKHEEIIYRDYKIKIINKTRKDKK